MRNVYKHFRTNEIVYEEDAEEYALDHLGITIKPLDKHGAYTQEQIDFLGEFTDWFFDGDWIEEEIEDDEPDLEYELEMADRVYQENLDRRLGVL